MKKLILGIVLLLTAMLLVGCGGEQPADDGATAPPADDGAVVDDGAVAPPADDGAAMDDGAADDTLADGTTEGTLSEGAPEGSEEGTCGVEAMITPMTCSVDDELTSLDITYENTGREDLEGVLFRVLDEDNNVLGETSEMAAFTVGGSKMYTLDLSQYAEAKKLRAYPVSAGVICANQVRSTENIKNSCR